MYFIFDTETSGLPKFTEKRGYYDTRDLEKYDTSRIVSISWLILNQDLKQIEKKTFMIKPKDFVISQESINIHGITNEHAQEKGIDIRFVLSDIADKLKSVSTIVGHNVNFDVHILKSECYRYGYDSVANLIDKKRNYCTMEKGKELLMLKRYPKLSVLYETLFDDEMVNAHDAEYDTYYCCECFKALCYIPSRKKSIKRKLITPPIKQDSFNMGDKKIELSEEQKSIVYADVNKNMLVVAVAGSGKTTTIILRIKYLVDCGINESQIMLTTFTKDAANDMEKKLFEIFGYKPSIIVGTIDSIAFRYLKKYCPKIFENNSVNVGEYSVQFSRFLKTKEAEPFLQSISHLFIDEFQDINEIQYNIFQELYKHNTIINAVGDDAQNIYTFRGSDVKYILKFNDYFNNSETKFLTTNYRSTKEIVAFANATLEKNDMQIPKTMVSYQDTTHINMKPSVYYFEKSTEQFKFLYQKIVEYLDSGYKLCDIAVLCPQNSYLYQIEELLTKKGISNVLLDGKADIRTKIKADHVCLSSIHKSKGLEWDIVFMIMMNDEVFPSKKMNNIIYESRRLFYVGVTRAKSILNLTYSNIFNCSYISRFVSELDTSLYSFHNFRPNCIGFSQNSMNMNALAITKLIENLDGHHYVEMKELGLFPDKIIEKQKQTSLYDAFKYETFIVENDIYSDFGTFLHVLISRMISEAYNDCGGHYNESCALAISCVKLDGSEYNIYQKYRNNFNHNMKYIGDLIKKEDDIYTKMRTIISLLLKKPIHKTNNIKSIESNDISLIISIIKKIYIKSIKYHISMDKIPIFIEKFLPDDFEILMSKCLKDLTDKSKRWKDILLSIWEVSKCEAIVKEKRRRLLYKKIIPEDIESYHSLYENLDNLLIRWFKTELQNKNPICNEILQNEKGITGEIDVRFDDYLFDFKCSNDESIKAEYIVQLLAYVGLYETTKDIKINYIGIINPLKGFIMVWDIRDYDKGDGLIEYLMKVHQDRNQSDLPVNK